MHETLTIDRLQESRGATVYDSAGDKIGKVEEIFYDDQTNQPEWIGIGTGFFGTKRVLVPVEGATLTDDGYTVPYSKDQVKDSPDIDSDEISQGTEQELYSYYGLGYSERRSDGGLPERDLDAGVSGAAVDSPGDTTASGTGYVTRAEEELRVGKREVGAGRARLRKWVETEPVETDVELRRETARVYREPVEGAVSGAEIGEEQVDVDLTAEEAVVEKQAVAKERIGLEKDVRTERQTVSDEVRKERVDVENDGDVAEVRR
jgi:uncharacterized protein (TIGR02271 family)